MLDSLPSMVKQWTVAAAVCVSLAVAMTSPRPAHAAKAAAAPEASSVATGTNKDTPKKQQAESTAAVPAKGEQSPDELQGAAKGIAEDQEKAIKLLEDFLKKHPSDITALRMMLRVRMKAAQFEEGIKVLDQLIEVRNEMK